MKEPVSDGTIAWVKDKSVHFNNGCLILSSYPPESSLSFGMQSEELLVMFHMITYIKVTFDAKYH
jgi:hypothetical protein